MHESMDGLLRDKTQPSRIPLLAPQIAEQLVARTLKDPPGETTHWTGLMTATQIGISVSLVQRIWRAYGLKPHRICQFKLSNDPKFVQKLRDNQDRNRIASLIDILEQPGYCPTPMLPYTNLH